MSWLDPTGNSDDPTRNIDSPNDPYTPFDFANPRPKNPDGSPKPPTMAGFGSIDEQNRQYRIDLRRYNYDIGVYNSIYNIPYNAGNQTYADIYGDYQHGAVTSDIARLRATRLAGQEWSDQVGLGWYGQQMPKKFDFSGLEADVPNNPIQPDYPAIGRAIAGIIPSVPNQIDFSGLEPDPDPIIPIIPINPIISSIQSGQFQFNKQYDIKRSKLKVQSNTLRVFKRSGPKSHGDLFHLRLPAYKYNAIAAGIPIPKLYQGRSPHGFGYGVMPKYNPIAVRDAGEIAQAVEEDKRLDAYYRGNSASLTWKDLVAGYSAIGALGHAAFRYISPRVNAARTAVAQYLEGGAEPGYIHDSYSEPGNPFRIAEERQFNQIEPLNSRRNPSYDAHGYHGNRVRNTPQRISQASGWSPPPRRRRGYSPRVTNPNNYLLDFWDPIDDLP